MVFDRLLGDAKMCGNVPISPSLCEATDNGLFPGGQGIDGSLALTVGRIYRPGSTFRVWRIGDITIEDPAHNFDKIFRLCGSRDDSRYSFVKQLFLLLISEMRVTDEYPAIGRVKAEPFNETIEPCEGYLFLDKDQVGPKTPVHCDHLNGILSLSDHAKIVLDAEKLLQAQPEDAFTISNQNFGSGFVIVLLRRFHRRIPVKRRHLRNSHTSPAITGG